MKKHVMGIVVIFMLLGTTSVLSAQRLVISAPEGANLDIPQKVLTEAYKRIGVTIEFRRFPTERSLQTANSGETDGELMRLEGIEKDYPNLIRIPVPIMKGELVVITKEKIFEVKGWESLVPYKVGYVRGVKIIETNLAEGTYAEAANSGEQAFRKLEAGRTDVVVEAPDQAHPLIEKLGLNDLVILEPPLLSIHFFHYLHAKNQHLVKPLTQALQQMEDEGLIQRMYQQVD